MRERGGKEEGKEREERERRERGGRDEGKRREKKERRERGEREEAKRRDKKERRERGERAETEEWRMRAQPKSPSTTQVPQQRSEAELCCAAAVETNSASSLCP